MRILLLILFSISVSFSSLFAQENDKKWGFGLGYEYTFLSKFTNEDLISQKYYGTHKINILVSYRLNEKINIVSGFGVSKEKFDLTLGYDNWIINARDTANLTIEQFAFVNIPLFIEYEILSSKKSYYNLMGGFNVSFLKRGKQLQDHNDGFYYDGFYSPIDLYLYTGISYVLHINKMKTKWYLKYSLSTSGSILIDNHARLDEKFKRNMSQLGFGLIVGF
jgi:hypothetical protein